MEVRGAKASELEEGVELQRLVFRPNEDAHERYRTYVRDDPSYDLGQTRVVIEDGKMVGHLRIWDRLIQVRGARLRAGGIGSVLIHPDYRGRGFAHALMKDADSYMADAGYDVGLLFTIIGTPFYEAQGWTPILLPTFEFSIKSGPSHSAEQSTRLLNAEEDLDSVAAIYKAYSQDLTGPEIRSRDYWTSGPSRIRGVFPEWGVDIEGSLAGYVTFGIQEDHIWVKEACTLAGSKGAIPTLAERVATAATESDLLKICGSLLPGHPFVKELGQILSGEPSWGTHDEMMLKVMNWETVKQKLGGEGAPEHQPEEEGPLWRGLFGREKKDEELGAWIGSLPECVGPFYWWTDIF
jgi:predicted N-acetyltransferase YhbS